MIRITCTTVPAMLPPVLEIYVVWHPDDEANARPIAQSIIDHYHGDQFSGLIGGAVEVYVRSAGWHGTGSEPRPIPFPGNPGPPQPAAFVAVIALLGNGLARSLLKDASDPWHRWLAEVKQSVDATPTKNCLHAYALDPAAPTSVPLAPLFAAHQLLAAKDPLHSPNETMLLRDLSQTLAQFLEGNCQPIQVFVSHTKHMDDLSETATKAFISLVREEISQSRLAEFFDSHSIQAGEKWAKVLEVNAAQGAMLSLRTDRYAGREWCHREVVTAKIHGVPVVAIDALMHGDSRGSFVMDHMPRVPASRSGVIWDRQAIRKALVLLVDECLKRALWRQQERLAGTAIGVAWWAPHAPEPLTLAKWLQGNKPGGRSPIIVLHPDPPLTPCEREIIDNIATLAGCKGRLEVLTPRTFAARSNAVPVRRKGRGRA